MFPFLVGSHSENLDTVSCPNCHRKFDGEGKTHCPFCDTKLPVLKTTKTQDDFCIECNKYVVWRNGRCPKGHRESGR